MSDIEEEALEDLYGWVDQITLSRPKRDMKRDFSDGVLVAEVVKHFCPRLVESHNYSAANRADLKLKNWSLLNRKVFKRLGFEVGDDVIQKIIDCKQWAVEHLLMLLRRKIERHLYEQRRTKERRESITSDQPEVDQVIKSSSQEKMSKNISQKGGGHKSKSQPILPANSSSMHTVMVAKVLVEEKEQDILMKDETIQILQAKVRRLEHLVHLKEIRIDDLQSQLNRMELQLRPPNRYKH